MESVGWVWSRLRSSWITGSGRGVGVPGGVSGGGAWLFNSGGLVNVNAVVGHWGELDFN